MSSTPAESSDVVESDIDSSQQSNTTDSQGADNETSSQVSTAGKSTSIIIFETFSKKSFTKVLNNNIDNL